MKKILLLLLLVLVLAPPIAWKLADDRTVDMVLVDASVIDEKAETHAGITWLTEQMRIRRRGERPYRLSTYYGYFPDRSESVVRFAPETLAEIDLLYLCDLHGVWRSDLEQFEILRNPRRDSRLHSGLSKSEVDAVVEFVESGRTVIAEAFFFHADHEENDRSHRKLQETFAVEWTGWIGGSFHDLGNVLEVPFWARTYYEREIGENWEFDGPGIILMKPEDKKFLVLRPGLELREAAPKLSIIRRDDALTGNIESGVPLYGWFEIVEANRMEQVRAMIQLSLTGVGDGIMRENRIPTSIPAVVTQWINRSTYYLAADLGTIPNWLGPAQVKWMPEIRSGLAGIIEKHFPGEEAFWKFYIPFMRNVLDGLAY
jgi:hypothetical protein